MLLECRYIYFILVIKCVVGDKCIVLSIKFLGIIYFVELRLDNIE